MALKINTKIENDVDEYLLDARAVKGTYVVVTGIGSDTKENLPKATVTEGTLVYDAKEKKSYRFISSSWVVIGGDDAELNWGQLGSNN